MRFDGTSQVPFDEVTSHWVQRVRLQAAIENQGTQNEGLHVHIVVEIEHTTMVQVKGSGLYDYFRMMMPSVKCNIHSRFIKGEGESKAFVLKYLTKEVSPTVDQALSAPRSSSLHRFRGLAQAFVSGETLVDLQEEHP